MKHFIFENQWYFPILLTLYIIGVLGITYNPEWPSLLPESTNYTLFCLSFISIAILLAIGIFLLSRWKKSKDKTTLIWGISFLLYTVVFFGLLFKSLGFQWANDANPAIFFCFRQFMILWAAGIIYGLSVLFRKGNIVYYNDWALKLSSFILLIGSYAWFYYTLILNGTNIGSTLLAMHGFLGFFFIPTCAFVAFLFIRYGYQEELKSMRILGVGFSILSFSYLLWSPFHDNAFYYVAYSMFILSIILILLGFVLLSAEKYKLEPNKEMREKYCKKCHGFKIIKD